VAITITVGGSTVWSSEGAMAVKGAEVKVH
jgi:hypothetical protein